MEDDRTHLFTSQPTESNMPAHGNSQDEPSPSLAGSSLHKHIEMPETGGPNEPYEAWRSSNAVQHKPIVDAPISNCRLIDEDSGEAQKLKYRENSAYKQQSSSFGLFQAWWAETLACIIIVAVLCMIIGILYPHQDSPLPNLPYHISINSLLAILVVIMKAAMLLVTAEGLSQLKWAWFKQRRPLHDLAHYDMASRGPWGSAKLLVALRGRHFLANLGAFVTIAALTIDPFAQQVVRYYDCTSTVANTPATIPKTQLYSELGEHLGAGLNTIPPSLQSAINGGIFNPGLARLQTTCPTGNCTFPEEYHSIGYCSSCTDISKDLNVHTYNTTYTVQYEHPNGTTYGVQSNALNTNISLPSGLHTTLGVDGEVNVTYFVMAATDLYGTTQVQAVLGPQAALSSYPLPGCSDASTNDTWSCRQYGAAECSLYPCVQSYTGGISSGSLTEQHIGSSSNFGGGSNAASVDVGCLTPEQKQYLIKLGYQIPAELKWLAYNVSIDPFDGSYYSDFTEPNSTLKAVPRECIYSFYGPSQMSISYFMQIFFAGSIVPDGAEFTGPSFLQTIYNQSFVDFASIESTFKNISDSMTVHIRQNGNSYNNVQVLGQILRDETCVHVRWAWLAFPAALVGLTLVFFVLLILGSRVEQYQGQLWKSSLLPLVFHGLHEDALSQYDRVGEASGPARVSEMESVAKRVHVRFNRTDMGWKFTKLD